ncbi:unnamed protein product [Polarella glacialis]|uniref:Uncharacterized protein n=1 Tax=Polarella glacialis TaxID=89957 RepID=A0A813J008_POLGL|nr:unnamed protein product [Polarella glacialis]
MPVSGGVKIAFVIGVICIAIGVIMNIVTRVTAETDETSFVIDWVAEDIRSFTLPALEEKGCNYEAYVEKSKCSSTVWTYTTLGSAAVSPPTNGNCTFGFDADDKDPALEHIGYIPGAKASTYVTSSNPMWVMDSCKEIGEAINGVATFLIISAIGGCCCGVGVITVCVAACCCCCQQNQQGQAPPAQWQQQQAQQQPYGGAQMVGQPVTQGQVVQGQLVK